MSIGDNIRSLRVERELSQKALAEKLGVAQSLIAAFEIGTKVPSVAVTRLIAETLSVTTDDIIIGK